MKTLLLSSLVFVFLIGILCLPSASALPVSYNTTSINLGLTSVPRNSSSYDVFPLIPDNWLWEKFDNNTIDSSPLGITGTITYNTNAKVVLHLENTLNDATPNANNGVVTGTTTYVSGVEGQGFSFNGVSYISLPNTSTFNFTKTQAFSVSVWVKTSTNNVDQLFAGNTGGNCGAVCHGWQLWQWGGNGKMNFDFHDNLGNIYTTGASINQIGDNTYHHFVVTYDGSGNQNGMKMYEDGVLQTTGTTATISGSTFGKQSTTIGAGGASVDCTCKEDEFRFYNITLTAAQVSALHMVGHYSQSHTFDGGEYVSLGNNLGFENTNPFTITFWEKSSATDSNLVFYAKSAGLRAQGISIGKGTGNTLLIDIMDGASSGIECMVSPAVIFDGNYHFIAISYSGSKSYTGCSMYIDGSSQTVQNNGFPTISGTLVNTNPTTIGAATSDTEPFQGQLDNLKVYPYALSSSQITSDYNSISPISSGKQFMSWYNGVSGSATLTQKLGTTKSSLTLACNLSNGLATYPVSNLTKIYYGCTQQIKHIDINSGTNTHDFTINNNPFANTWISIFFTTKNLIVVSTNGAGQGTLATSATSGNSTGYGISGVMTQSNQKLFSGTTGLKFNYNNTSPQTVTTNQCEINFLTTNTTKVVDNIACDKSLPANTIRYWNGMMINRNANYASNSTQLFLNSIDASSYKKLLSLPCIIMVNETPCDTFILTDLTQTDWLVVLTSTHVYYGNAQTALSYLNNHNYAFQSYDVITQQTSSSYEIQNPILQSMKIYGPVNFNVTSTKAGLFTLPSGYSVKTTSIESAIRTIDPRWTNDATDIPIITSTGSLFPIFLTVSNAPVFSAIKVTNPYQLINSQESVWAVAQLDSTRTVEFDLPSNVCVNIYVADISVSPSIWNFQGIICANGVNQKTISYTNTLPFTFWTYPWGASDSFTPNTNGLVTTVRHTTAPFSYNIILKNSTGTVFQNTTYTSNSTIDTQNFNLTGRAKPVSLYINSVTGGANQIYSAFLGSPISLDSTASFFNQYFSYQGFNLLAFIPIIFASMFTRNTIGIGVVLTVLCIATLSWLSVVVIPELDIMIMIVIAIIGLIAYRLTYY